MLKSIFAGFGVAALLLTAMPSFAQGLSPVGQWEIESRDSRYDVTLCGDDGTALCARLIWLGNGADNAENTPYLNSFLIENARPSGTNKWRGTLKVFGQEAAGTVTQINANQISLQGCFLAVFCKTYQLHRYSK